MPRRRGGGVRRVLSHRPDLANFCALLLVLATLSYLHHRWFHLHTEMETDAEQEGAMGVAFSETWEEDEGEGEVVLGGGGGKRHRVKRKGGASMGLSMGASLREEDEEASAAERDSFKSCPSVVNKTIPTLEGLSLGLSKGMTWEDVFITQLNYQRLLHHEFSISPGSVRWLPASAEQLLNNYRWRSCATVGNSGGLRYAQFGGAINSHDLVLRANQAITFGYEKFVGSKTTFRILNKSWTSAYAAARFKQQGLPMERSVSLVITRSTGKEFDRLTRYLKNYRGDVAVLYLSSRVVSMVRTLLLAYRVRLCASGRGPYDGGAVPSSGLVAVLLLMQLCKHVTVYGYGHDHPPSDPDALYRPKEVPYHYFVGNGARRAGVSVHSWHSEEMLLHELHREGRITFCRPDFRGQADPEADANNRFCGLNPFLNDEAKGHWMQRHAAPEEVPAIR